MALARWIIVLVAAIAGALLISFIYDLRGTCAAAPEIVEDPLAALLNSDAAVPSRDEPYEGFDPPTCTKENWQGITTIWLLTWGPICLTLIATGFVAARHGGPPSFTRSTVSAALAAALALCVFLEPWLIPNYTVPVQWLANCLILLSIAGALGTIGAAIVKRHA